MASDRMFTGAEVAAAVQAERATLLALADCVECLTMFANEGIAMTPDGPNSDPQDVLCRLMDAMEIGMDDDWSTCAAALRARAAEDGE